MPITALYLQKFVNTTLLVDPDDAWTPGVIMLPEQTIAPFTAHITGSGGLGKSAVQGTGTSEGNEVDSKSNKMERMRSWNVSVWVTIVLVLSMVWIDVSSLF